MFLRTILTVVILFGLSGCLSLDVDARDLVSLEKVPGRVHGAQVDADGVDVSVRVGY